MRLSKRLFAFTIIELLVSMSIVMVLLVVLFQMVNQTSAIWRYTSGKVEQFRGARAAFESITRNVSQATLNTYLDYDRSKDDASKLAYVRQSELRFLCGPATKLLDQGVADGAKVVSQAIFFQAPLGFVQSFGTDGKPSKYYGLDNLLNSWGYFVKQGDDSQLRPDILGALVPTKTRYRLMEFMQSSDRMTLYAYTSPPKTLAGTAQWQNFTDAARVDAQAKYRDYNKYEWFATPISQETAGQQCTHVLAENVVALIFQPKLTKEDEDLMGILSKDYEYNSALPGGKGMLSMKNQLPPVVKVTMVAIDEESAARLQRSGDSDLKVDELFTDVNSYEGDLKILEDRLLEKNLKFRVFSTDVTIRGAKWSRN